MFEDYRSQFKTRHAHYASAMEEFPNYRTKEFQIALPYLSGRVLDVCSGNQNSYEYDGEILNFDPVFRNDTALPEGKFDTMVCTAAFHHIPDGEAFAKFLHPSIVTGGHLVIVDPWCTSTEARDLDLMIPGHSGHWMSQERLSELSPYFQVSEITVDVVVPWGTGTPQELSKFCRTLFDVRDYNFVFNMGYRMLKDKFYWKVSCAVLTAMEYSGH